MNEMFLGWIVLASLFHIITCSYVIIYDTTTNLSLTRINGNSYVNNTEFYKLKPNCSLFSVSKQLNQKIFDDDTVIFAFIKQTWLTNLQMTHKNYFNFGTSLSDFHASTTDLINSEWRFCLRYTKRFSSTITSLILSFYFKRICVVIEDNYCSQIFIEILMQGMEVENNKLEIKVIFVNNRNKEELYKEFYDLKSRGVNLIAMLAPIGYFQQVYDAASHFGLEVTVNIWLIPEFLYNYNNAYIRRVIYFHSDNLPMISKYPDEQIVKIVVNAYEEAVIICSKKNRHECIESLLYKAIIDSQSENEEMMYITVQERMKFSNGTTKHSASKVNIRDNRISFVKNGGITVLHPTSDKRFPQKLRVVVIEDAPFVFLVDIHYDETTKTCSSGLICTKYENNATRMTCCNGIGITILSAIISELNLEFKMHVVKDSKYGAYNNGKWNGLIGELVNNQADIAVATLTTSSQRSLAIDFAFPFMEQIVGIVTKPESENISFFNWKFMSPLSGNIQLVLWLIVIGMMLITYLFENSIYITSLRNRKYIKEKYYSIFESMSYIGGVSMQRDLGGVNPNRPSSRAAALIYAFGMVIFVTTYTARLAALSLQKTEKEPFQGSRDSRMRNPTEAFKFAVSKDTNLEMFFKSTEIPEISRMSKFMEPYNVNNVLEGVAAVKNGSIQAFMDDYFFLFYRVANDKECELRLSEDTIARSSAAFALQKNSPFINSINEIIMKLTEKEQITEIIKEWFTEFCQPKFFVSTKTALGIKYFGGLVMVLTITMFLCFPLLITEIEYYKKYQKSISTFMKQKLTRKQQFIIDQSFPGTIPMVTVDRCGVIRFPSRRKLFSSLNYKNTVH